MPHVLGSKSSGGEESQEHEIIKTREHKIMNQRKNIARTVLYFIVLMLFIWFIDTSHPGVSSIRLRLVEILFPTKYLIYYIPLVVVLLVIWEFLRWKRFFGYIDNAQKEAQSADDQININAIRVTRIVGGVLLAAIATLFIMGQF